MKKTITTLAGHRVSRFAVLGVVNTLLDFVLLNVLRVTTHTQSSQTGRLVVLNIFSASVVALFSFFMNRRYVFRSDDTAHHKAIVFVLVTLFGIFVLQSLVISVGVPLLRPVASWLQGLAAHVGALDTISINFYETNLAKLLATAVTMVWNYTMYKKAVFQPSER
jgi:putative flippase GtrA